MEQKIQKTPEDKGKGGLNKKRLESLGRLRDQLRLLVLTQEEWVIKARNSDDPGPIHEHRLHVYDQSMRTLISCFEWLEEVLYAKHPGGAPSNQYRNLAFDVLTDHYTADKGVLRAKPLIKALAERLPENALDADISGKEPFSERIAREVIRDFKACLHSTPDDWN